LIYEVHRSSRAEARKEEKRKQEMEVSDMATVSPSHYLMLKL